MPEIVLTDEQTKQLAGGFIPVLVKDSSGRVVGRLEPTLSPEMIAELKRRAATGPFYSSDQVRARLQALENEWQRVGGFDSAYALAFLERLNARDPGKIQKPKQEM
jgi:hypothetical protein